MAKIDIFNTARSLPARSRSRSILVIILFALCLPVFLYQLVPTFTKSADTLIEKIISHFRDTPCTADIGDAQCCALFVKANPCVEECRKQFIDRETFTVTLEYDQCADSCLREWGRCNGVTRKSTG